MATRVRFTGDGREYLDGIPARDIEDDEWEALSAEQQSQVSGSALYELSGSSSIFHPVNITEVSS